MRELALFAGAGGGILGSRILGWRTVCAVEIDPYCRGVLIRRQSEGHLEPFPIWDDIRTFDGQPWRGRVDIVTGGFPCQDISAAGKGGGIDGEKSSLWFEMARVIREVRPRCVLVENSPMLTVRGLDRVLGSLAAMGYDARWGVLGADDAGAPHIRKRIWIRANRRATISDSDGELCDPRGESTERDSRPDACPCSAGETVADTNGGRCGQPKKREVEQQRGTEIIRTGDDEHLADAASNGRQWWGESGARVEESQFERPSVHIRPWPAEPDVGRVAYGVADRVDRLTAIGNGQVPRVVAIAWGALNVE